MKRFLAFLTILLAAPSLYAWGEKGHYLSSEAATHAAPPDLPPFFHAAYARLIYLGYDPDRWRGAGPSLEAINPPNHFLDYEYVADLELPPDRYEYLELLRTSGTLRRYGISMTTPGFVPWKIAELSDELEQQWRLWRRSEFFSDRQQIEESIIRLAGELGHYVADSANPHHATIHYNGWVGVPNPNRYPTDCETHSRFESQFVSRHVELSDVLPHLRPLLPRTDYFDTGIELIRDSQSRIEALYHLDRDGAFAYPGGSAVGREFAADRIAVGASTLRDLWVSTYRNSQQNRRTDRR
jgi:hypothetical protein